MQPLSATECISPAIQRAKDLLARPFRLRTYLKLCALAFFAEIGSGSCNLSSPGNNHGMHGLPPGLVAFVVAFAVIFGVIGLVVWLALMYLSSRLQLVLVEVVATRQQYIAPFWHRQGPATWRWLGVKLLFFLGLLAMMAIVGLPFLYYAIRHRIFSSGGSPPILWILLLIPVVLLVVLVMVVFYGLLRSLVLPSIALEGLSASEAIRRARAIVDAEPGQVALFLLLQLLLTVAIGIGAEILLFLTLLLSLIPFGLVGGGAWLALHHAGAAGMAALIGLAITGGLVFVCWAVCLVMGALGPVYVFSQAYSLYFLGGRYPLLGNLLDETTPVPLMAVGPGFMPPPIAPPEPGMSL
ncbi:MAG TPA: hypothetical protein VHU44_08725 [Acidobacteriaceae bacterium]|jgi:hypothetical protein|nr:hypothetical protein [Acidobacteriaceae bacterium]